MAHRSEAAIRNQSPTTESGQIEPSTTEEHEETLQAMITAAISKQDARWQNFLSTDDARSKIFEQVLKKVAQITSMGAGFNLETIAESATRAVLREQWIELYYPIYEQFMEQQGVKGGRVSQHAFDMAIPRRQGAYGQNDRISPLDNFMAIKDGGITVGGKVIERADIKKRGSKGKKKVRFVIKITPNGMLKLSDTEYECRPADYIAVERAREEAANQEAG